jgi:hypothetical protein
MPGGSTVPGGSAEGPRSKSLVEMHLVSIGRGGAGASGGAASGGGPSCSFASIGADADSGTAKGGKKARAAAGEKAAAGDPSKRMDWDPKAAPWRPFDREKDLDVRRADPSGLKRALNDHVMGTLSSRFGTKGKTESSFI